MIQESKAQLHIREMNAADLPAVEALDRLCFTDPWPAGSFTVELEADRNSICLVAEGDPLGARLLGMIVVWLIVDEAHIGTLCVHPEAQGGGIGAALLAAALEKAAEKGAKTSLLEVRAGNQAALGLYTRFGYKVVGRRAHYYQDNGEDALLLTLDAIEPGKLPTRGNAEEGPNQAAFGVESCGGEPHDSE
jgi:ribosomal-protein-alanine N-acetyltransferase